MKFGSTTSILPDQIQCDIRRCCSSTFLWFSKECVCKFMQKNEQWIACWDVECNIVKRVDYVLDDFCVLNQDSTRQDK